MARRTHDDALGVAGAETIIGTGVVVHGELTSDSDIIIDGTLEGTITTEGNLTIGVNAHIKANITATNVMVAGNLKGNITASGETTIRETGRVEGDIRAIGLAITSGGLFMGRSIMETPPHLRAIDDDDTPDHVFESDRPTTESNAPGSPSPIGSPTKPNDPKPTKPKTKLKDIT